MKSKGYAAGGPTKSKGMKYGGKVSKGMRRGGVAKSKGMSSGGKNRTRKNTKAVGVAKRGFGKAFINSKR